MPFSSYTAGLFEEEVRRKTQLAAYRTRRKRRGMAWHMKPDDVIKRLSDLGVTIGRMTLSRYVNSELITPPDRRHGGKGVGPIVDYPEYAIVEAAAAADLTKNKAWSRKDVLAARERLFEIAQGKRGFAYHKETGPETFNKLLNMVRKSNTNEFDFVKQVVAISKANIYWTTLEKYNQLNQEMGQQK